MAYRITNSEDVAGEVQRIVTEQVDKAVDEIDNGSHDAAHAVHQVRKRCKKIRAVLKLARGALKKNGGYTVENARFREIARGLSVLRDSKVLIDTHDAVTRGIVNPDLVIEHAAVRGRLITRHYELADECGSLADALLDARRQLIEGRERIPDWARRVRRFRDLEPGLKKTYRDGREAMRRARKTGAIGDFHEWRKHAKYHWHACGVLRAIWPDAMAARCRELDRLSELLGHDHDLGVYRQALETNSQWLGHKSSLVDTLALVDRRREALHHQAYPPGARLYAEKPGALATRFGKYWQAWRESVAWAAAPPRS